MTKKLTALQERGSPINSMPLMSCTHHLHWARKSLHGDMALARPSYTWCVPYTKVSPEDTMPYCTWSHRGILLLPHALLSSRSNRYLHVLKQHRKPSEPHLHTEDYFGYNEALVDLKARLRSAREQDIRVLSTPESLPRSKSSACFWYYTFWQQVWPVGLW